MKNVLQKVLLMSCKFIFYGIFLQVFFAGFLLAESSKAQDLLSVKQVYVNLNLRQADVAEVFKVIESQTEFKFFYDRKSISKNLKLDLKYSSASLHEVLLQISKEADLRFKQVNNTINVKKNYEKNIDPQEAIEIFIQTRSVSGKVTSMEDEEGLPGVNVVEKGTSNGTVTDVQGNYSLKVSEGATLVFSSVGYTTEEVEVGNRTTIDLVMNADIQQLQELVVVGYGTSRKRDLTGSIASVRGKDLRDNLNISLEQAMTGKVAGVQVTQTSGQPGAPISIRVRGGNSISASNEPLYVIDGFPVYTDNRGNSGIGGVAGEEGAALSGASVSPLAAINPNDIESIEILKDASAASIYGARGANGVVLITTKRGKKGQTSFSFDARAGIRETTRKYDMLNGTEGMQSVLDREIEADFDPADYTFTQAEVDANTINTDWQDLIMRTGTFQEYSLSASGGTDNVRYAVSGNFLNDESVLKNTNFTRYSARINMDLDVTERLTIGTSLLTSRLVGNLPVTNRNRNNTGNGVTFGAITAVQFWEPKDENGNWIVQNPYRSEFGNPLAQLLNEENKNAENRIIGNFYGDYKITNHLNLKVTLGTDINNIRQDYFSPADGSLQGFIRNGWAKLNNQRSNTWLNENTLSYNKQFTSGNSLNVVAGFTTQGYSREWSLAETSNFAYGGLGTQNMSIGADLVPPTSGIDEWTMASWLGRVFYNINEKYMITVSARYDGSSRFGANNKWAFFPSAAIGWNMHEEGFMSGLSKVSNLKLRLSHGLTGNQEIPLYRSLSTMGISNHVFNGTIVKAFTSNRLSNPELRWEKTRQTNFGIDFGMFNNRLELILDAYYKVTTDLLLEKSLPQASGYASALMNVGSLENRGLEITLNTVNTVGVLDWNTNFNISFNRNKVLSIDEEDTDFLFAGASLNQTTNTGLVKEGEPVGNFFGYVFDGIYQTDDDLENAPRPNAEPGDLKLRDLNGDNAITDADRTIIGDANPDFIYGFTNTFNYKNFDLSIFIQGSYGNDIYNWIYERILQPGGISQNSLRESYYNRWTPTNPSNEYPALTGYKGEGWMSSQLIEDGSYLRVRNVRLGYNFNNNVLQRLNLQGLNIFVSANNLLTFTQYSGFDPEVNTLYTSATAQGIDVGSFPTVRTYLIGANIKF